jgi:hypothetical protein
MMSAEEYRQLQKGKGSARARTTTPKREKEADSSDLSLTPLQQGMSCISIKALYVEYYPDHACFTTQEGHSFRLTLTLETPVKKGGT